MSASSPANKARGRKSAAPLAAVILAAGEGKRMKSSRAKVLHEAAGRPLVDHVVRAARGAGAERVVVVVGVQSEEVRATLEAAHPEGGLVFAEQTERLGTGDAVGRAKKALRGFEGDVLILCGDVPGLDQKALAALVRYHRRRRAALTVLTAELEDPSGYGRLVRDARGRTRAIIEHRDADDQTRAIREINTGTYVANWPLLVRALAKLRPDNDQGEYYLTDAVRLLLDQGHPVEALVHPDSADCMGVNSRRQLAEIAAHLNRRKIDALLEAGVTVIDPASTFVHESVRVGRDVVLHPRVTLEGDTTIGEGSVVHSGSRLRDTIVGKNAIVKDSVVAEQAEIGARTAVGPFAHLRPGTRLGAECKVGNFVETKKAHFDRGAKASHLSYIGDAEVGRGVNIGAGTITCNYDGVNKHKTVLEQGVFIGSDTQLVAPVRVGKGAYVGAGSTITKEVPPGALALTRSEQRNIEGWVARKKGRAEKAKKS